MKYRLALAAVLLAGLIVPVRATVTGIDSGFTYSSYYNNSTGDGIVSYDWDSSGNLYYMAGTSSYTFGGLYQFNGSATTTVVAGSTDYVGASAVYLNGYVYYNASAGSTQKIYRYDVAGGTKTLTSTAANYGLYAYNGSLYVCGAGNVGDANKLGYATPAADGSLPSSGAITAFTAATPGVASGPLAFDAAGNLYYAPGWGSDSIYRWTAAEVSLALADPVNNALVASSAWFTFGAEYADQTGNNGGATSMVIGEDGNIYLTLTSWTAPSVLVEVNADASAATTVLTDSDRLGEVREKDGSIYVSSGSGIYQVSAVPEPSTVALLLTGLLVPLVMRRRQLGRTLSAAAIVVSVSTAAWAGPYSGISTDTGSTAIKSDSTSIVEWAAGYQDLVRGPVTYTTATGALSGAAASYGTPESILGGYGGLISLGNGGTITLTFSQAIMNGAGADFAVFENAMLSSGKVFAELAMIAVSSDGEHFYTFPSISLTQTTTQVGAYGTIDPSDVYNLAGKDLSGYGTAFDLDDLLDVANADGSFLDLDNIQYVRVTDVVGSLAGQQTLDSAGNVINDSNSAYGNTAGFDLTGVGVVHAVPEPGTVALVTTGMVAILGRRLRWSKGA
ncbi:MAG: hypothetical protein B9S32_01305 [Verrucomicrobia bacterium Tous-C9LFEB]|nr:MAG: hypothetical protein B9S32_01305 [Verrucomicrobia bacterium Tous-C9LFEB]